MVETEKRAKVLKFSLNLEYLTSKILSYLLNIDDHKESFSFGNKSSSLSFNQKLNLLIDNDSINKKEKKKLVAFSSIRNQFMHNINANTFEDVFDHLDGLENLMRKLYPGNFKPSTELEDSLGMCVSDLHKDGVLILTSYKGGIGEKMNTEVNAKVYGDFYKKLEESVRYSLDRFLVAVENLDSETISISNLVPVIGLIQMNIFTRVDIDKDLMDEILNLLND